MSYQNDNLAPALGYHFMGNPDVGKGLSTEGGRLTEFHPDLGPPPTDSELESWVAIYDALPADHPFKDPRAARIKRFRALPNTLNAVKQFIEEELL